MDFNEALAKRNTRNAEHKLVLEFSGDFDWEAFIQHVWKSGGGGHSFPITVDPGDSDYEKSFGFDGDGADRIVSATIDGKDILK